VAPPQIAAGPLKEWKTCGAKRRNLRRSVSPTIWPASGRPAEGLLAALRLRPAQSSHANQLLDRSWSGADRCRSPSSSAHWRTAGCGPACPVVWEGLG